jgi:aspartate kinase
MASFDEALDRVEEIRADVDAKKVVTNEDLCALAVFGPHFREIPNVASQVFKALAEVGINILAISTSVSSVTCVFKQEKLSEGLASLRGRFEIP